MPWNDQDYPASFKNLEPEVREKAIEIANALLKESYEESRAIAIATAKARDYIHGENGDRPEYEVKPRQNDWILIKADGARAIYKETTKHELLEKAKPYVNDQNGVLSIYHEDGSFENKLYE